MHWFDEWALTLAVFVPLAGLAAVLCIPRAQEHAIKVTALLASVVTALAGIGILADFDYGHAGKLQFIVDKSWIPVIKARYHMGVDGIALPLLILSMLMVVACIIYSWNHFPDPHNPKAFLALILLLEIGMNGTFAAQDLILFFVFFEVVLLPMFFMIGVWGRPKPPVRGDQVLPVHAVRLSPHARELPRHLLLVEAQHVPDAPAGAAGRRGIARGTKSWCSAVCSSGSPSRSRCSRSIPGSPTLIRRRRPSARCSLGDPPEARGVRLHPNRAADPAGRGTSLGSLARAPRRHRHHLRGVVLPGSA